MSYIVWRRRIVASYIPVRNKRLRINLTMERIKRGMTVRDVSRVCGVHDNSVRTWEKGTYTPGGTNLTTLCTIFGKSPSYLLEEQGEDRVDSNA